MSDRKWRNRQKRVPADTLCKFFPNCNKGTNCRFKHPAQELTSSTTGTAAPAASVKTEPDASFEGKGPAPSIAPPPMCPHCARDTRLPRGILKSAVKNQQEDPTVNALDVMFKNVSMNAPRPEYHPYVPLPPSPMPLASFSPPPTPSSRTTSQASTPKSFDLPRPPTTPQVAKAAAFQVRSTESRKQAMESQQHVMPAAYVVANWGISTNGHEHVKEPSLRQLSQKSHNAIDMGGRLHSCSRLHDTDKGGSVIRYEFFDRPDTNVFIKFLHNEIVEFASMLHNRLVAELLYRQVAESTDEIIVYYACQEGQSGYFRFYYP